MIVLIDDRIEKLRVVIFLNSKSRRHKLGVQSIFLGYFL